jgi:acetyltransferase-like isoleucine patch superfamily enzyme
MTDAGPLPSPGSVHRGHCLALELLQRLRHRFRREFWTRYYRASLRLHPAVRRLGRIQVTGRVVWMLHPDAVIELSDGVRINSALAAAGFGGVRPSVVSVGAGARLSVGANSGFTASSIICTREIVIESDVKIGGGCHIFDSDFHSLKYEERRLRPDPGVQQAPVRIRAGAFIGGNSMVLKGVTVGERSVVCAGSVLFCDVPPDQIWAGNPARFIRKL